MIVLQVVHTTCLSFYKTGLRRFGSGFDPDVQATQPLLECLQFVHSHSDASHDPDNAVRAGRLNRHRVLRYTSGCLEVPY